MSRIMNNKSNDILDYIGIDLGGYEYNKKYPPMTNIYGNAYDGYESPNKLTFFYDFCVQFYGVSFWFGGKHYEAEFSDEGVILKNESDNTIQGPFGSPLDLIEHAMIGEEPLIKLIDQVENVVLH